MRHKITFAIAKHLQIVYTRKRLNAIDLQKGEK